MESSVVRRTVVISDKDPQGLHLRPAQLLSQMAEQFQADIEVIRDTLRVDGKSIMQLITLAGLPGVELAIEARGVDAQEAVDQLVRFIESGFAAEDKPGE